MIEETGDLWHYWPGNKRNRRAHPGISAIVIPTNGSVASNGAAVMGKGLALQAKQYFCGIEFQLGNLIKCYGNNVYPLTDWCIAFPTKDNWRNKSSLKLIEQSARQLRALWAMAIVTKVALPRVGCGEGRMEWEKVRDILEEPLFGKQFVVVQREEDD